MPGGWKRVRIEIVSQGCGAIHGASRLRSTIMPTINRPALSWAGIGRRGGGAVVSSDSSAIADLRIEPCIEQVGRQVGEGIDGRHHEYCGLQHRQVALLDREDEQP